MTKQSSRRRVCAVRSETKGDGSPVTVIDRAVEDRLRAMIAEAYPDHGIVGEERGASAPDCR